MTFLGAVYETVERVRNLKGKEIHNMQPADGRILVTLEKLGVQVM